MTENLIDDDLKTRLIQQQGINNFGCVLQFVIWVSIFCLFFFIVGPLLSTGIIYGYYKTINFKNILLNSLDLNAIRYAQVIASIFSFLIPALVFSKLKDIPITKYSDANIGLYPVFIVLIPLLLIAFYPIIDVSFFINKVMPWNDWLKDYQGEYKNIVDGLLKNQSAYVFILNFMTIAIVPAVCEEWIFRGTLQKLLSEKLNIHLAVFIASVFFSFIHFEFSGFLPRVILGMFLGYLFYYSGSLWTSIFAHVINNGSQVIFMYLNNAGIYKMDVDNPVMPKTWELIVYTIAFTVLWYIFMYFAQKRKSSIFVNN